MSDKNLGLIAYEAYFETSTWKPTDPKVWGAWEAAARAVLAADPLRAKLRELAAEWRGREATNRRSGWEPLAAQTYEVCADEIGALLDAAIVVNNKAAGNG